MNNLIRHCGSYPRALALGGQHCTESSSIITITTHQSSIIKQHQLSSTRTRVNRETPSPGHPPGHQPRPLPRLHTRQCATRVMTGPHMHTFLRRLLYTSMFSLESSRRQTAARAGNPRAKRHSHSDAGGKPWQGRGRGNPPSKTLVQKQRHWHRPTQLLTRKASRTVRQTACHPKTPVTLICAPPGAGASRQRGPCGSPIAHRKASRTLPGYVS